MNNREKAIAYGYELADWIGDMSLAYSPVMIFLIMALATASIALRGAIATNGLFGLAWAIATAVCVDGLWLGVWLRVRGFTFKAGATWLRTVAMVVKYVAILLIALFMLLVAMAMSILITYQQVNGVTDELLAMRTLHFDSLAFVIARGFLVMLCATLAIFFRAGKQEALAAQKKTTATPKTRAIVATPQVQVVPVPAPPVAIPAVAASMHSPEYEAIKKAIALSTDEGKLTKSLKAIALESGVGYSTVKKHAAEIKKELGI